MNEYEVEEWSVDTRRWKIKSLRQLTREEVFEIYEYAFHLHTGRTHGIPSGKFAHVSVTFIGTRYGDNSEYEMNGDFKEEEE
tara:strand:+ start:4049 stop:4294 length:246 start_codon:yes stop_codon:yes gene_type:complete